MRVLKSGRGLATVAKTQVGVINGDEDLGTWTEEELERGQRRGSDGRFRKPPVLIARQVHDELVRRRLAKAYDLLRESVYDAVALLREIITDAEADPALRLRASELVMDRVMGRAPTHIDVDVQTNSAPWQRLVASAIVATEDQARELVEGGDSELVEGEVIEDGSDEDDFIEEEWRSSPANSGSSGSPNRATRHPFDHTAR